MKKVLLSVLLSTVGMVSAAEACKVVPKGTCYVKETQEYISADEFFSRVSNRSNGTDKCAVGRVKGKESGRMYWNGRRLSKDEGCLSHNEISELKQDYGISGQCETFTCEEL